MIVLTSPWLSLLVTSSVGCWLVVREVHLSNLEERKRSVALLPHLAESCVLWNGKGINLVIGLQPERVAVLDQVKLQKTGFRVKQVGNVFSADENFIPCHRPSEDLSSFEVLQNHVVRGVGLLDCGGGVVESKEVLQRQVDEQLLLALLLLGGLEVDDLQPVARVHAHAVAQRVRFVQRFADASVVVLQQAAVVDELDASCKAKVG